MTLEEYTVRRARIHDVPQMAEIIKVFAQKELLLMRTMGHFYENLRDFAVVEGSEGEILALGALHVVWEDLAELRSIAVREGFQHNGLGTMVVIELLREADAMNMERVFMLTYQEDFFNCFGFKVIDKSLLPHKIWSDCLNCPHFPDCDEVAMILYKETS